MTPAVLLIIFNRPNTTKLVMQAIKAAQPKRFYVFGDGPRDHDGERDRNDVRLCVEARKIATAIDWPYDLVETCFAEDNLGCRYGPVNAISWFLEHEPEGIILEDDCVPSPSFFAYCGEMLGRFRDDTRIMAVCGDNYQQSMKWCQYSYYFSRWFHTWGWATWARAWSLYDGEMKLYPDWLRRDGFKTVSHLPGFADYWQSLFDEIKVSKDIWDYQWQFSVWANSGLTVTPRVNMVSNIGFGPDGTHCQFPTHRQANLPSFDLAFPLSHPSLIIPDSNADDHVSRFVFQIDA